MSSRVILFDKKEDCCGCGACMNICSKQTIEMQEDEYGFLYPAIEEEKCIQCHLCNRACGFQSKKEERLTKNTYVAMAKDEEILKRSASGGVFAVIASEMLRLGGVIFGSSMELKEDELHPEHVKIEFVQELSRVQGSKYVQSFIGDTYKKVKETLETDKPVLFSGTPCQVAGLKSYLMGKEYSNLYTIDVICHGVPSAAFFRDYIKSIEKKLGGRIVSFQFRDKTKGWGYIGSVEYEKGYKRKKKIIHIQLSSYYKLYLDSGTCRESCYSCKYAGPQRTGDLTIGDYWGVQNVHPEYLLKNEGDMDEKKGISCILVNTEQGLWMLEYYGIGLKIKPSTFEKVEKDNGQLKKPSPRSSKRDKIFALYRNGGYAEVEKWFMKSLGIKRYAYIIWLRIPEKIRKMIRGNN